MKNALVVLIDHLKRCAEQNEKDAKTSSQAKAVAAEQRRVIVKLRAILALKK